MGKHSERPRTQMTHRGLLIALTIGLALWVAIGVLTWLVWP